MSQLNGILWVFRTQKALTYQTKTPLLVSILFLITMMEFLCLFKTSSGLGNNSDIFLSCIFFQHIVGSSISLASFKTSEPTLVQDPLSQANIAFFVAAEVDIPEGSGGESNLKAVVINTPLSDLMDYDSDSGVYYNTARVYLSDLGEKRPRRRSIGRLFLCIPGWRRKSELNRFL